MIAPGLYRNRAQKKRLADMNSIRQDANPSAADAAWSRLARQAQSLSKLSRSATLMRLKSWTGRRSTGWAVSWHRFFFPCDFMATCRICRNLLRNAVPTNNGSFSGTN